jgi:hypothetical protein
MTRKNPRGEPGAEVTNQDLSQPSPNHGPRPAPNEYWLHVKSDGTEIRYAEEPSKQRGYLPTIHVVVDGDIETTWILREVSRSEFKRRCNREPCFMANAKKDEWDTEKLN